MAQKTQSKTSKAKGSTRRAQPVVPPGSAAMAETFSRRLVNRLKGSETQEIDIIDAIKEDHKPLKEFITIFKDEKKTFAEKKRAFERFAPILEAHAKPEEQALYADMRTISEMKVDSHEGDIEHEVVDTLVAQLKRTTSRDIFLAKVKVVAELLDHHIREEENDMLPDYKSNTTSEERYKAGAKYLKARSTYLAH